MQSTQLRICSFCLSFDRRTTPLLELSEGLLNMKAFNIYSQSTPQLCWECNAHLKNYSKFRERAERAQQVLDQLHTKESLTVESLSSLVITNTLLISIDSQIGDINDKISTEDCTQLIQNAETVKNMTEIQKEKSSIHLDFEAWNFDDDYLEHESLNICGGPKLSTKLLSKEVDEVVDEHMTEDGESEDDQCSKMHMEDTQNGTKNINVLSFVKKSDVNCSQNLKIDNGIYKKFITFGKHGVAQESTSNDVRTFECHHCKMKFENRLSISKHIRNTHPDDMKCKHCSQDFNDRKSLHQHMTLIHDDKMLACDICGSKYASSSMLRKHVTEHRNLSEKTYTCGICSENCSCRFKEQIQQYVHDRKSRVTCYLCETVFEEEEALESHLECRHSISKDSAFVGKKSITLLSFKKNDPPPSPPPKRKKIVRRKFEVGQPTKCEICEKECKFPSVLEYHRAQHFDDKRPFKCNVCNKGFKYKPNLYMHMVVHSGEKPYMCDVCGTSFAHKCTLVGHMRIHAR